MALVKKRRLQVVVCLRKYIFRVHVQDCPNYEPQTSHSLLEITFNDSILNFIKWVSFLVFVLKTGICTRTHTRIHAACRLYKLCCRPKDERFLLKLQEGNYSKQNQNTGGGLVILFWSEYVCFYSSSGLLIENPPVN